jgi:excisionase family DNA binding protein
MTALDVLETAPGEGGPPPPGRPRGPRTPDPEGEWLSLTQAAAYLGVGATTVDYYTRRTGPRLRAYWVGGHRRRFRRGDLDAWKRAYREPRPEDDAGGEVDQK